MSAREWESRRPAWQLNLIRDLRERADELRTDSFRLEALADKIESPPDGVRVEYAGWDAVRFVGPTLEVSSA